MSINFEKYIKQFSKQKIDYNLLNDKQQIELLNINKNLLIKLNLLLNNNKLDNKSNHKLDT